MKAIVYDQPLSWTLAQIPDPEPGPGQARLRVVLGGVCGTDVHLHQGKFDPRYPLTPGHEILAVVDELGPAVAGIDTPESSTADGVATVGELVALDNMLACGHCTQCRRRRPQFCHRLKALGVTDPGGFAEFIVAPAAKCYPVGDLDPEVAVLAEPVACVVHGLDMLNLQVGSDVLVLGTGPTGLILTQLLRSSGAGRVVVAGRQPFKLELAANHGADDTVLLGADLESGWKQVRELAPDGYDVVIDATGSTEVLARGASLLGIGGTLFVYGMAAEAASLSLSPYDIFRRELVIRGSFSQGFSFDRAVRLLRTGRVRTDGIITHRFGLDDYARAIDTVAHDPSCVKAVIVP